MSATFIRSCLIGFSALFLSYFYRLKVVHKVLGIVLEVLELEELEDLMVVEVGFLSLRASMVSSMIYL